MRKGGYGWGRNRCKPETLNSYVVNTNGADRNDEYRMHRKDNNSPKHSNPRVLDFNFSALEPKGGTILGMHFSNNGL